MRRLAAFSFALLLATPAAFAQNNDMRAVMNRLNQMQNQMDTISRQVYKGETPPAGALSSGATSGGDNASLAAAVDDRMNSLEGSLRQINNRLDEQDYAIGQMKQSLDLLKSDIEVRFKEIGSQPKPAVTPMAAPSDTPTPAASSAATTAPAAGNPTAAVDAGASQDLPTDNAAALYDAAFQALREQKYDRAEGGFREFMTRYPTDQLAGNAQYWLGETYYVRGNYAEAAKTFAQGYQKYPKSSKAPDNLLKLGLSLSQQNKKQEACVTFQQLNKQYSNAAAVIKQRADDESRKLNCGGPTG